MNYSVEPPIWLIGNRRYVVLDPSTQTADPPERTWCIILHTKGNKFHDFISKLFIIYTKRTRHDIFFIKFLYDLVIGWDDLILIKLSFLLGSFFLFLVIGGYVI